MGEKEEYTIKIGKESAEGSYFIKSKNVDKTTTKGWGLVRLFGLDLAEIFPRKISVEIHNSGFFSEEMDEGIDALKRLYTENVSSYEKMIRIKDTSLPRPYLMGGNKD